MAPVLTARTSLYSGVALAAILAVAGAVVAWRIPGASASAPTAPPATVPAPPPPSTSTTAAPPPSTSTTTSTSTSTSTTVRPKPVTTTAKPRVAAPATTPATAPRPTQPPAVVIPGNFTPQERCANSLEWVRSRGLALPPGWGFRCPGEAILDGTPRWGIACWNCNGDGQSWIAVDIGRIGASDKALRHVIAHETCHAIDYATLGLTTELGADLCAALHGAPR